MIFPASAVSEGMMDQPFSGLLIVRGMLYKKSVFLHVWTNMFSVLIKTVIKRYHINVKKQISISRFTFELTIGGLTVP